LGYIDTMGSRYSATAGPDSRSTLGAMWNRLRRRKPPATLAESAEGHLGVTAVNNEPPSPWKAEQVNDQLDVDIHDVNVLNEIEMMTNLIIATSESDGPLTQSQIDSILGVSDDPTDG